MSRASTSGPTPSPRWATLRSGSILAATLAALVGTASAQTSPAERSPAAVAATPGTAAAAADSASASSPGPARAQKAASAKSEVKPPGKSVGASTTEVPTAKGASGARDEETTKNGPTSSENKGAEKEGVATEVEGKPKGKAKAKPHARVETGGAVSQRYGEGPSPASPPPLNIAGLRDEMHREGPSGAIDPATPARSKVEQMLAEVTKARAALHADTDRLEAMMAGGDGAADAGNAGNGAASGAAKPSAKNPLDVLAKALRGIKPDQAAPIVSRLDKRLAASVLQRMPPADAGKIMGAMKPDTAAELATQIAMRQPSQPSGEARK